VRGQANGLWLWQSDVGGLIVDSLLPESSGEEYELAASEFEHPDLVNATQELEI
jgi:hypothetical protein